MTLEQVGENGLLEILRAQLPLTPPGFSPPIHDVAHVPPPHSGRELVVTTDMLVSGIHFDPKLVPAFYIGWRAIAANLSDVAAAGGEPQAITISLGLPQETEICYLTSLYRGMVFCLRCCGENAAIVGGDIVRNPTFTVSINVIGYASSKHRMGRAGAVTGDFIVVSGWTGRAARGWQLLQQHTTWLDTAAVNRFLNPIPRLELGRFLSANGATALTDTSDSLYEAVYNLAHASRLGAEVWTNTIPLSTTFSRQMDEEPAYNLAWGGGEDYELVAAIPPKKLPLIMRSIDDKTIPLTVIGRFMAGEEIALLDSQANSMRPPQYFQHF